MPSSRTPTLCSGQALRGNLTVAAGVALALLIALPLPASAGLSIAQINAEAGGSWTAGETPLSRLTPEEQRSLLGLVEPPDAPVLEPASAPPVAAAIGGLPAAFDWRENGGNFVTPVRH